MAQEKPAGLRRREVRSAANLFQRAIDVGELGVQIGAEAIDHSNDRKRNPGGDQPIFDGSGAGLVRTSSESASCDSSSAKPGAPGSPRCKDGTINKHLRLYEASAVSFSDILTKRISN
jgi:hypothetical protein